MTTYQPYNPNRDTRPTIVSIGCEIATRQMEQYDMGHGEVAYIPIKTQIVFLDVPREVAFTEKGDCDYNHIAVLLQNKGYPRSLWTIRSIWECQDDTGIF